ncbi:hypothetical protein [Parasitella parasitica]|uniref:Uncharacterized protein n=1 Tax=Parasitella parasitica TaxID=35722 RepID=A0A0B7N0P2_9FUNG|nr:hypothetical protein [Parasitella parasitica]
MQNSKLRRTWRFDPGFSYRRANPIEYPTFTPTPEPYPPVYENEPVHNRYEFNSESSTSVAPEDQCKPVLEEGPVSFNPRRSSTSLSQKSSSSSVDLNGPAPPSHVTLSDFYIHVPCRLTSIDKIRQLLIWIAERELDKDIAPETQGDPKAVRAKLIAKELKTKFIERLKRGDVNLSWYNRPDKMEEFEEKENPINIHNKEKLDTLKQNNRIIQAEIDDWKLCSGKVYQAHAEAKDAILPVYNLDYKEIDKEFICQNIDEQQLGFYLEYCKPKEEEEKEKAMLESYEPISDSVTQIRQVLNTTHQFVLASQRLIHRRRSHLAKQICERERIIPTEYDYQCTQGVFFSEDRKKESELRNIQRMIYFCKSRLL